MKETARTKNCTNPKKKRNYKTYSYALKRQIVYEIMKGIITKEEAMIRYDIKSRQSVNSWIRKYSLLNYHKGKNYGMKQNPEERIKELKAKIEELEHAQLILNTAIDIADEKLGTNIRKKYLPQQLKKYKKKQTKK